MKEATKAARAAATKKTLTRITNEQGEGQYTFFFANNKFPYISVWAKGPVAAIMKLQEENTHIAQADISVMVMGAEESN